MQNLCLDPEFVRDPLWAGVSIALQQIQKKVLQIYEGPFSIVAEARLELTTFGL